MQRNHCRPSVHKGLRETHGVAGIGPRPGPHFNGHGNGIGALSDRCDYRLNDPNCQRLVSEQSAARRHIANLACRASHINVDDLGAALDIKACSESQYLGLAAG
jgi:hypothetical protein